jgi:hypothetical protein
MTYKRNASVDVLKYNSDGTIQKVIVTSEGPDQIKSFNPYDTIQSETIWKQQGIKTEFCNEGGVMLTNIAQGDYTSLKGVDFGSGAKTFEVRAASASSGGTVEVHLDSPTGTLVASCAITGTNGWQTWKTFSCEVNNCSGIKNVYFVYKGSGEPFRLNWFRFTPDGVSVNQNWKPINLKQERSTQILSPFSKPKISNGVIFYLSGKMVNYPARKSSLSNLPSEMILIHRKK